MTSSVPALLFPKASTTTSVEELARFHSDSDALHHNGHSFTGAELGLIRTDSRFSDPHRST